MRISVESGGTFAGGKVPVALVDTAQINPTDARRVEELVRNLGFFNLAPNATPDIVGADIPQYDITITDGSRQHTVTFKESNDSSIAALKKFVEMLSQLR
jgi:hypothetical protein